ncbi:hypothetical protein MGI18_13800 [Bacillus sp. OVS6]|nr:hypothetical protein MGI18_13800 [Bacillus sp. OVS6]
MAVKTNFSSNNLKAILSNYNLGELVYSDPITKGTVQTNIFIMTTTNKLVFRYYENRTTESVLFEINLMNYLQEKNIHVPLHYVIIMDISLVSIMISLMFYLVLLMVSI